MRNIFILGAILLISSNQITYSQELFWKENNNFQYDNLQSSIESSFTGNGSSFNISQSILKSNETGFVEISDFKINGFPVQNQTGMRLISLYLTPENSFSLAKIHASSYSITYYEPENTIYIKGPTGNIDLITGVTLNENDIFRIEKTESNRILLKYNTHEYLIIDNYIQDSRISFRTDTNNLSFIINNSGFYTTDVPEITVTDDYMNWIFLRTYNNIGQMNGATVSYYDNLGNPIQAQTRDFKSKRTWVNESRYDYQGRQVFSTLKAPLAGTPNNFTFKEDFILKYDGDPLTTESLEWDPENPPRLSTSVEGTLGWYYGANNTLEPFQDTSDGRPYIKNVYDELNPGEVRAVVGGKELDYNGNGINEGIFDKFPQGYSYTMPSSQELYYAFGKDYFSEGNVTPLGKEVVAKINKTIIIDPHGNELIQFSDNEGNILANSISGGSYSYEVISLIGEQGFVDVHIPKGINSMSLIGSGYTIINLRTQETILPNEVEGGNIYRISHTDPGPSMTYINNSGVINYNSGSKGVIYNVNYYDFTLNYYDKSAKLKKTIPPLGFNPSAFDLSTGFPQHSMATTLLYNVKGQVINTTSPDAGSAFFVYRDDGNIRFSKNSKQNILEEFSYTNYDEKGRPIESGVSTGEIPYFSIINSTVPDFIVQDSIVSGSGSFIKIGEPNWIDSGIVSIEDTGTGNFQVAFQFSKDKEGVVGLSETDVDGNYKTVEFGYYFDDNQISIINNGDILLSNAAYYDAEDIFYIERDHNSILFKKNNSLVFQMYPWADVQTVFPSLFIDGALYDENALVENIIINELSETSTTTPPPPHDWDIDPISCKEQVFSVYDINDTEGLHEVLYSGNPAPNLRVQKNLAGNISKTFTKNPETATTWYSYDVYGRVEWMVQYINGLGAKTIDYEYDNKNGAVNKVTYQKDNLNELFIHKYLYNELDQLITVTTSRDNLNFSEHAKYFYYETGQLKRTELAEGLQGTDYVYTFHGQLKAINHPGLSSSQDPGEDQNDAFGLVIDYFDSDYTRGGSSINWTPDGMDRFDGNIKGVRWGTQGLNTGGSQNGYLYNYNNKNWLTSATFGSFTGNSFINNPQMDYKVFDVSYDPNGNITQLKRNKSSINGNNNMDRLTYYYNQNKNQLNHVDDTATAIGDEGDIKDQGANNYIYNSIGQLIENKQDTISYSYFTNGLVSSVYNTLEPLEAVHFKYNDRGHRVSKMVETTSGYLKKVFYVRDFSGNIIAIHTIPLGTKPIIKVEYPIYGLSRLGMATQNNIFTYELKDHLGNIRAVIQKDGNTSVILSQDFNGISTVPGNWTSANTTLSIDTVNERLKANVTGGPANSAKASFSVTAGNTYSISFEVDLDQTPNNLNYNVSMGGGSSSGNLVATQNGQYTFNYTPLNTGTAYLNFSLTTTYPAFQNNYYLDNIAIINTTTTTVPIMLAYKDYYPFGMPMPDRNIEGQYPFAYQGKEKDLETGMEAFELRLWDARIGRWLTTDPYGQFASPYLGMGNNPINGVDPNGGFWEEFGNWLSGNGWNSNAALSFQANGGELGNWVGDKLTGHRMGYDSFTDEYGNEGPRIVIFRAVQDQKFMFGGREYEFFLEGDFTASIGLQLGFNINNALSGKINLASADFFKYNTITGLGINENSVADGHGRYDLDHSIGVAAGLGIELSGKSEYSSGSQNIDFKNLLKEKAGALSISSGIISGKIELIHDALHNSTILQAKAGLEGELRVLFGFEGDLFMVLRTQL